MPGGSPTHSGAADVEAEISCCRAPSRQNLREDRHRLLVPFTDLLSQLSSYGGPSLASTTSQTISYPRKEANQYCVRGPTSLAVYFTMSIFS